MSQNLQIVKAFIVNEEGRDGSTRDVDQLEKTFSHFGTSFNVQKWCGNKDEILQRISELKNYVEELQQVDGVIVVAMCHSQDTNEIYRNFYAPIRRLDVLKEKFVLLISQGCRGSYHYVDRELDGPVFKHIIWFSTGEDVVAERTPKGSPFIQGVCKNLLIAARERIDLATIIQNSQFEGRIRPCYRVTYDESSIQFYLPRIE